ncbi:Uncharacterised protein [Serratia fonticola]|nr:Uncharacterised protein [Serratia fonticola]
MAKNDIKHPKIQYHGGKFRLALWIIRRSDSKAFLLKLNAPKLRF